MLTLSAGTLMAQQTTGQTPLAAELTGLSNQWISAAQRHDSATLARLVAPEFTLVHPSLDSITRRAEWLTGLARTQTKAFRYENLKVTQYGDALAVVSAIFVVDAMIDGQALTPVTAVTDVWSRRGDRWVVVTRYVTRPQELGPRTVPTPPPTLVEESAPMTAPSAAPTPPRAALTPPRAASTVDLRNAPGCTGIVARALAEAVRLTPGASSQSSELRDAFYPFEVEHAATTTSQTEILRKSGFSWRDLLVQFVVDTAGVVELPTIKVLGVTAPPNAKVRDFDVTNAAAVVRLWHYRPAQVGGCAVRQVVQEPVRTNP